jgi:ABC-type multidrug transport system fused ATPase/permease subunit
LSPARCATSSLDPARQASEADVWRVLDLLNLRQHVEALANDGKSGLDSLVAEGGANWSVGQRQIICIARALLRRSPVICLDEATSNIDAATDEILQRTIRSQFKHATLIMIAHRLTTIADADQVVLMDQGRVLECDSPAKLLANKRSHFAALMQQMSNSSTLGNK